MNHKYIALLLACTAGAAQAQRLNNAHVPSWARPEHQVNTRPALKPHAGAAKSGGDVVFSEDFANGLAGNNGVGAWTQQGPNGDIWVHSYTGPTGAYTTAAASIIQSTTVSNGFMKFASDSANTDWSQNPPAIVADPVSWEGSILSPVIDLSATPYVLLEFQQRLRYCCQDAPMFIEVTTDGGNTWPGVFDATVNWEANADVLAPTETFSVNISNAIQDNPANVQFRFRHSADAGSSHYHWQVDDVRILEAFSYDLTLLNGASSSWDPVTSFTYDSLRYSVYPISQLHALPLNMVVANNGSEDQNGSTANFRVTEGVNTVLDQDQSVDLFAGTTQTIYVDPDFVPPAVPGTYDVEYSITASVSDTTTDNNTASSSFKVSDFVFGRDMGTVTAYETGDDTNVGEYELCNLFHITNDVDLYSVDVALRSGGSPTVVGQPILGTLHAVDDDFTLLAETMEHEVLTSDLNGNNGTKFIPLIFNDAQFLEAGGVYMVCVKHYGDFVLRTGVNGVSEPQTSFIFYNGQNGLDWYYTTITPMVRMDFNQSVGIEEGDIQNGVGLGQNYPNPSNSGNTVVPFSLTASSNVTLEVHDLSGKVVRTMQLGNRAAGTHRVQLDTHDMNSGVYFYTLNAGEVRTTKRMTVLN